MELGSWAFALRNISSCRAGYSSLVPTFQTIYSTWSGRWLGWKKNADPFIAAGIFGYGGRASILFYWAPMRTDYLYFIVYPAPPVEVLYLCSTLTESNPWSGLASNLFSSRLSLVDGRQAIAGSTVDPKSLSVEISTRLVRDDDEGEVWSIKIRLAICRCWPWSEPVFWCLKSEDLRPCVRSNWWYTAQEHGWWLNDMEAPMIGRRSGNIG